MIENDFRLTLDIVNIKQYYGDINVDILKGSKKRTHNKAN